jgi:hypothetical protein
LPALGGCRVPQTGVLYNARGERRGGIGIGKGQGAEEVGPRGGCSRVISVGCAQPRFRATTRGESTQEPIGRNRTHARARRRRRRIRYALERGDRRRSGEPLRVVRGRTTCHPAQGYTRSAAAAPWRASHCARLAPTSTLPPVAPDPPREKLRHDSRAAASLCPAGARRRTVQFELKIVLIPAHRR